MWDRQKRHSTFISQLTFSFVLVWGFLSQRVEQKQREFALKHERWQPSPPSFACKHVIPDIVNISHIVLGALSFRNETNTLGLQFALAASSRTFGMISSYLTCFHSWEEMTGKLQLFIWNLKCCPCVHSQMHFFFSTIGSAVCNKPFQFPIGWLLFKPVFLFLSLSALIRLNFPFW